MGTIKISILEIDGQELDYNQEMDLQLALDHIGFTGSGFDVDLILTGYEFEVLTDQDGNVLTGV